ncbi:MAG: ABC transporter ATP-binding protein [Lachnospiraceae bacterium]|nr:ABC transporter ATP-binding protein [Lachnospiraceae bacterium]
MFLKLKGLKKLYEEEKGLKYLDLEIEKGSFVTLLGPSGCGKTTTLNLLGGFIRPDSGKIYLEGDDITDLPPERRPVSTVFQSYALFPHLNVLENVCYGLRYFRGMKKKDAIPAAREQLKIVGLEGYEKAAISEISGGQQQRVALARAMATGPKILLLDEPLSNLDAGLRVQLREELKELQKKLGITMIFVTHDQEEALSLSDRIVVMEKGIAVQVGTPREVYYQPESSYVASFVGKANYVECHGRQAVVRPEDVWMKADPAGPFEVKSVSFMGSHTLYEISDGTRTMKADLAGREGSSFRTGDRVQAGFQTLSDVSSSRDRNE